MRPASRSSLPARLHAVEVAVDVELQENRRVEGGSPSRCGLNTVEPEIGEIECVDEGVDHADGVFLVDPVVEALREKRRLPTICSFDEPLHGHPPGNRQGNHRMAALFTQPGSGRHRLIACRKSVLTQERTSATAARQVEVQAPMSAMGPSNRAVGQRQQVEPPASLTQTAEGGEIAVVLGQTTAKTKGKRPSFP